MKKFLLSFLFLFSVLALFAQSSTPSKTDDIRKMMEISGAGKLGIQVMQTMMNSFQQSFPEVPSAFWKKAAQEFTAEGLIDLVVPIYDKHFTHEDIKGLLAFYESPVGQKLIEKLPVITQESMAAGEIWGEEIGQKVFEKLKKEGYIDR